MKTEIEPTRTLSAASWNVSAVNTNPFEYWVTHSDPAYNSLMQGVQAFIDSPANDLAIQLIFTGPMFCELRAEMQQQNMSGLGELEKYWNQDYSRRLAVGEFLKNPQVGIKRLVSLPDRITNTINLADGKTCLRPTVMNAYDGLSLNSMEVWWSEWKKFMFHSSVQVCNGKKSSENSSPQVVCTLVGPISRSKYPAITQEEQAISVPLQLLCLAIMDAILIHIVNAVAPSTWEAVRKTLCDSLIHNKQGRTSDIMASYTEVDVFFIQEAAAAFAQKVQDQAQLNDKYVLLLPHNLDGRRDQNSLILVDRKQFKEDSVLDVTADVLDIVDGDWVAPGDLLVVSVEDVAGLKWLLASFHGDSNGLSTQPILCAINDCARSNFANHVLLVGLDANTHSTVKSSPGSTQQQGVADFFRFIKENDMLSMWETLPNPFVSTTCNSRTFLQTQMNKATLFHKRASQQNLKDWILAYKFQMASISDVIRDNTGTRRYIEDTVFPTLDFPSDHALVSAKFHIAAHSPQAKAECTEVCTVNMPQESESLDCQQSAGDASENLLALPIGKRPNFQLKNRKQRTRRKSMSLYDYWGIVDAPVAQNVWSESADENIASDQGESEDMSNISQRFYEQIAVSPIGFNLDTKNSLVSSKEERSIWIVFSTRPVSMAFCKPWFIAAAFLGTSLYFVACTLNIVPCLESTFSGMYFRFTPLQFRGGGGNSISWPAVHSLGLMQDGCRLAIPFNSSVTGSSTMLSFTETVTANGWWFMTAQEPNDGDPILIQVERSVDSKFWTVIPTPEWMLKSDLEHVPESRLAYKFVDLRAPLRWIGHNLSMMVQLTTFMCACALGAFGFGHKSALCCSVGLFLSCFGELFIAIFDASQTDSEAVQFNCVYYWILGLCFGFSGVGFVDEKYALDCYILSSLVLILFLVLNTMESTVNISWNLALVLQFFSVVQMCIVAGTLLLLRWLTRRWVFLVFLQPDQTKYDELWTSVRAQEINSKACGKLHNFVCKISASLPPGPVLQRHRSVHDKSFESLNQGTEGSISQSGWTFWKFGARDESCVSSLDQLFNQAALLDVFLKKKAKEWALASRGRFWVSSRDGVQSQSKLEYWESIQKDSKFGTVSWAKLKSQERALQKLLRCYSCETPRLLDCCRQAIYFDDLELLLACLETIAQDVDIEIVRIKNRFEDDYDSKWTAGFRSVVLNLRICSEETCRLGVGMHVCELQMTLASFARLQTEESHGKYLVLRNCRGAPSFSRLLYTCLCNVLGCFTYMIPFGRTPLRKRASSTVSSNQFAGQLLSYPNIRRASLQSRVSRVACFNGDHEVTTASSISVGNSKSDVKEFGSPSARPEYATNIQQNFLAKKMKMMEEQICVSMTRHLPFALYKDKLMPYAFVEADSGSLWDSPRPFVTALCKPWFVYALGVLTVTALADLGLSLSTIVTNNVVTAYHFRFTTLEVRGGTPAHGAGIGSLGIMLDGCDQQQSFNVSAAMGVAVLSFTDAVDMNGWWFSTSEQSIMDDPVRFQLECSEDRSGVEWRTVGASGSVWTWAGSLQFREDYYYNTPEGRGQKAVFDLQVPWQFALDQLSMDVCIILMYLCLSVSVATKNHMQGKWIVVATMACCAVLNAISSASRLFQFQATVEVVVPGAFSLIGAGGTLALALAEHRLGLWCGCAGAAYIAVVCAYYAAAVPAAGAAARDAARIALNPGVMAGVFMLCFSGHAAMGRQVGFARAGRLIQVYRATFDAAWAAVLDADAADASAGSSGFIARIRDLASTAAASAAPLDSVLQRRRLVLSPREISISGTSGAALPGPTRLGPPIVCLDQLYTQAHGLDIFLRLKVQQWALESGGCFPVSLGRGSEPGVVSPRVSFVRWERIVREGEGLQTQVRWAGVKPWPRAVEKLHRVHDGEVSRLLDVCRAAIFYESPADLLAGLARVTSDGEARLVRVRNRLDPAHDAAATAGYRDVCLNLRIESDETTRLGLETHVCEVRLVLLHFATYFDEDRQACYRTWRNYTGR